LRLITTGKITTETLRSDYARNYIYRTGKIIICPTCQKSRYLPKDMTTCRSCNSAKLKASIPVIMQDMHEWWTPNPRPVSLEGGAS
jgi:hypothetical protein